MRQTNDNDLRHAWEDLKQAVLEELEPVLVPVVELLRKF